MSRTRWRLTNRVIEGQSRSTKNTPKMPTHREQATRRLTPRKNESIHWVKECYRKQNPQATPCAFVFSIPVGGILKVSGISKNGTPSVPATILDPGKTVFSYCLICPRGRVRLVKNRHINKNIVNNAIFFLVHYLSVANASGSLKIGKTTIRCQRVRLINNRIFSKIL